MFYNIFVQSSLRVTSVTKKPEKLLYWREKMYLKVPTNIWEGSSKRNCFTSAKSDKTPSCLRNYEEDATRSCFVISRE